MRIGKKSIIAEFEYLFKALLRKPAGGRGRMAFSKSLLISIHVMKISVVFGPSRRFPAAVGSRLSCGATFNARPVKFCAHAPGLGRQSDNCAVCNKQLSDARSSCMQAARTSCRSRGTFQDVVSRMCPHPHPAAHSRQQTDSRWAGSACSCTIT